MNFLSNKVGIGFGAYIILLPLQPATEVTAVRGREIKEGMRFEIRKTIIGQTRGLKKKFQLLSNKVCEFKKVFYLCSPKRNGRRSTDVE